MKKLTNAFLKLTNAFLAFLMFFRVATTTPVRAQADLNDVKPVPLTTIIGCPKYNQTLTRYIITSENSSSKQLTGCVEGFEFFPYTDPSDPEKNKLGIVTSVQNERDLLSPAWVVGEMDVYSLQKIIYVSNVSNDSNDGVQKYFVVGDLGEKLVVLDFNAASLKTIDKIQDKKPYDMSDGVEVFDIGGILTKRLCVLKAKDPIEIYGNNGQMIGTFKPGTIFMVYNNCKGNNKDDSKCAIDPDGQMFVSINKIKEHVVPLPAGYLLTGYEPPEIYNVSREEGILTKTTTFLDPYSSKIFTLVDPGKGVYMWNDGEKILAVTSEKTLPVHYYYLNSNLPGGWTGISYGAGTGISYGAGTEREIQGYLQIGSLSIPVHIRVHPDGKCGILDHDGGVEILRLETCNGVLDENRKPINQ